MISWMLCIHNPARLMNNYLNRVLLWFVLLPAGLYRSLGVDMVHLKAILTTKLIIDDRTATGIYRARSQNKDGETSLATLFTMLIAFVMGLMFLVIFALDDDVTRMTFYFASLGFML